MSYEVFPSEQTMATILTVGIWGLTFFWSNLMSGRWLVNYHVTVTTQATTYLARSRTQMMLFRARRVPSLWGGGSSLICLECCRYRQRGSLFVSQGRLRQREGSSMCFERHRHERKRILPRARRGPSLAGGAPYLLRRAPSWTNRTSFVPEGRLRRRKGRHICLEW